MPHDSNPRLQVGGATRKVAAQVRSQWLRRSCQNIMVSHQISIYLEKELYGLWSKFNNYTAEMIIVKEKGRKLFPRLEYQIRGLQPDEKYVAVLTFKRVDDNRYKYSCGEWQMNGKGEIPLPEQPQMHQDGVVTGRQMMNKTISFDNLRITNNTNNVHMVILQSMHKYRAVLDIYQLPVYRDNITLEELNPSMCVASFCPDYIQFIAVTAYFNDQIRNLKIQENKYAKGHKTDKRYTPRMVKSCNSPVPSSSSTYTTPNTSPEADVSSLGLMRSLQYPLPTQMPQMVWNDQFNCNFNLFQYPSSFSDMLYPQYPFFPMQPPVFDPTQTQ